MRTGMQSYRGFTLIELMIVVVIAAVLLVVALPAYQNQVIKTKRSVAKGELLKVLARQEQYFVNNKAYTDDLTDLGYGADPYSVDSEGREVAVGSGEEIYTIDLAAIAGVSTARAFAVEAAPKKGQLKDGLCGKLAITSKGVKSENGAGSLSDCW